VARPRERPETASPEEQLVIVDVGVYDQRERCDGDYSIEGAAAYLREHPGSFCWIGLHDPKDGEVAEVGRTFPLPALYRLFRRSGWL